MFKTVSARGQTNDLAGASFNRKDGTSGFRVSGRGYTTVFNGYREDGGHGINLEAPVSIEDMRAALDAAEAAGVTTIQLRLSGQLEKARVVSEDGEGRTVKELVLADVDEEADEPAEPAEPKA